jgi:hypothetical protein
MTSQEKDDLIFLETLINTGNENFAEIEMRNLIAPKIGNKSFDSIRKRFFDIYLWLPTASTDSYINTDRTIHQRNIGLTKEAKNYLDHLKELQLKEKLSDDKLKLDYKISKRVVKSYPYTQFIAWASFIITLWLLFLKLGELKGIWPYHK